MSDKLKELLILMVAVLACSFAGSIKGKVGSNEAQRTTQGIAVGTVILAYKAWRDKQHSE